MAGADLIAKNLEMLQSWGFDAVKSLFHQQIADISLNLIGDTGPLKELVMHANGQTCFFHGKNS